MSETGAYLHQHHYHASGVRYVTVQCDDCLVVLNSGHHYDDDARHHAQALADEHNARHHA